MKHLFPGLLVIIAFVGCANNTLPRNSKLATVDYQQTTGVSTKDTLPLLQHLEGLYFGISEGQLGRRAWLLSINTKTGKGSLYMPPEILDLTDIVVRMDGGISFRSEVAFGDVIYAFNG